MTIPVTWVLQTNISSEASEDKLYRFLTAQGTPIERFQLIPFDDSPLPFPDDRPTIFYGSTSLVRRVKNEARFKPGVWLDLEASSFHTLKDRYGTELLNRHAQVMSLETFLGFPWVDDLPLFVRPVHDTKSVVGRVRTFGEWKERLQGSVGVRGGPTADTLIMVALPQDILNEWRVCVLEGKALTASSYRVGNKPDSSGEVPQAVLDYANKMAGTYSPQPVYMMDVCELHDGTIKVIEINTFNASGLYWMDVYLIARGVTAYVANQ